MTWKEKEAKFGKPQKGKTYVCELQHFSSKRIQTQELIAVYKSDCLWRSADDGFEIDEWNWDVISWKLESDIQKEKLKDKVSKLE